MIVSIESEEIRGMKKVKRWKADVGRIDIFLSEHNPKGFTIEFRKRKSMVDMILYKNGRYKLEGFSFSV